MDPARYRRAGEIFHAACGLEVPARGPFVSESCAGDAELEATVRAMLAADGAGSTLLDGAPLATLSPRWESTPERLGPFRVLTSLGRGAMGAVYEAEQDSPRRRVALKVLRAGCLTPALMARFRYEAELLGRLQHPGIAQVHASGCEDTPAGPQPWIAMELVRGAPLDTFARGLGLHERLELLARVADAVHHAHQRGIVHRDLKCANVLVDEGGTPKVLDFGVARAAESDVRATLATQPGLILGTLSTMSPEQAGAAADVDARTDVYALGAIAYELLAGKPPLALDDLSIPQALLAIAQQEPLPLSRHDRNLGGDVEVAVSKALRKDREQRYASAAAFADDLRRIVRGEPIAARAPSTLYLASKLVRRHRALSAALAAVLVSLVGGAAAVVLQARATARADREAREQTEVAAAIDRYLLRDLLGSTNLYGRGREVRVAEVLAQAADGVTAAFAGQPRTAAAVRLSLAKSLLLLGDLPRAEACARLAWQGCAAEFGERAPQTLRAAGQLVNALAALQRYGDCADLARASLEPMEQVLGPDDEVTLTAAHDLAASLMALGRLEEARERIEDLHARRAQLLGPSARPTLTTAGVLASCRRLQGELDSAFALREETVELLRETHGPDDPDLHLQRAILAEERAVSRRTNDPASELRAALADLERTWGPAHEHTLRTRAFLAQVLIVGRRAEEALAELETVLEVQQDLLGADHPQTLDTRVQRARALLALQRFDDAARAAAEAAADAERAGNKTPVRGIALVHLGIAESRAGRSDSALGALEEGLSELERHPIPDLEPLRAEARGLIERLSLAQ